MESNRLNNSNKIKKLAVSALLFALAIVFAIVEGMFPAVSVQGVKLGLSNIVVMYALFFLGGRQAFTIVMLKALFVVVTRGMIAGLLSFCGGAAALIVMSLLIFLFKNKVSYLIVSISGAVFHNLGQLLVVSVLYTYQFIWAYIPILLIAGVISGIATATLLRFIMPAFKKLGYK